MRGPAQATHPWPPPRHRPRTATGPLLCGLTQSTRRRVPRGERSPPRARVGCRWPAPCPRCGPPPACCRRTSRTPRGCGVRPVTTCGRARLAPAPRPLPRLFVVCRILSQVLLSLPCRNGVRGLGAVRVLVVCDAPAPPRPAPLSSCPLSCLIWMSFCSFWTLCCSFWTLCCSRIPSLFPASAMARAGSSRSSLASEGFGIESVYAKYDIDLGIQKV